MTGINQGRPEMAIGEPIRLGSNNEFEIEQHPVSDRLIIRDTVNGKVAYVRKERDGQIGGDGVLVKALKESKPVADDGRTHDTIQAAERAASGWVFVPPGTFSENVTIETSGLTLRGSGYASHINPDSGDGLVLSASNIHTSNVSVTGGTPGSGNADFGIHTATGADSVDIENVTVRASDDGCLRLEHGTDHLIHNCRFLDGEDDWNIRLISERTVLSSSFVNQAKFGGVIISADDCVVSNVITTNPNGKPGSSGIKTSSNNNIVIGCRIDGANDDGIKTAKTDDIIANNRVSDSAVSDIDDDATGTVLDGNLTGASN